MPERIGETEKDYQPNAEEIASAVDILSRLKPGRQPLPLFSELCRLVPSTVYELVPLRVSEEGKIQVLITERGEKDPWWPNEVGIPGAMVLPTDTDFPAVFERLKSRELGKELVTSEPENIGTLLLDTKRGKEVAYMNVVFITEGSPKEGMFYDIDALPENLIDHHRPIIAAAMQDVQSRLQGLSK